MDQYDENSYSQAESDVEQIRQAALRIVRITHPEIKYVVDRYTIDDYAQKSWEYPGKWYYMGLKLPRGFKTKEELIRSIAENTIRYFTEKR